MAWGPPSGLCGRPVALPYARARGDAHAGGRGATSCSPTGSNTMSGGVSSRPRAALSRARPRRDAQTTLAGRWGHQDGRHRAPARDVPGTPRAAGAAVPGAGTPDPEPARGHVLGGHGLSLLYASRESPRRPEDHAGHGRWAHGPWLDDAGTAVVSGAAAALGPTEAARASNACIPTPHCALVLVSTVKCRAIDCWARRSKMC